MRSFILCTALSIILGATTVSNAQYAKKSNDINLLTTKVRAKKTKKDRRLKNSPKAQELKQKNRIDKTTSKKIERRKKRQQKSRERRVNANKNNYGTRGSKHYTDNIRIPSAKRRGSG